MAANQSTVAKNPVNQTDMKRTKLAVIVLLVFGLILCVIYSNLIPILMAIAVVAILWTWNWHRMVYLNPESVIIGETGITMEFRYGKGNKLVPWHDITGVWISNKPNTVAQAVIAYASARRAVFVTKEIGTAVYGEYQKAMGRAPPEW